MPNMQSRAATLLVLLLWVSAAWSAEPTDFSLRASQVSETGKRDEWMTRGAEVFNRQCASCHGATGEGVSGQYETPLAGDRSIQELAMVIDQTMPEGEPDECQGDDAFAVSMYIYESFYSEAAQLRNAPPRAAFARLTGEQYRQSLTDLYHRFRRQKDVGTERGLEGIYFNHAGWREAKKAFERTDALIDFDYGEGSPGEGIGNEEFGIYWNGGLLIPETGRYELIARGLGSFKVKFIDTDEPLFDNHVQSGDIAEYKKSLELVGGRLYPIQIEFIKRKRKTGIVPASFELAWRVPGGTEEVIPTRYLVPGSFEKSFAPQTQFPPDDRSAGYERGSTISREWETAVTQGAIEFADIVLSDLWPSYQEWHQKQKDAPEGRELLRKFACEFVDVALRRPAGDSIRDAYVDQQLASSEDDDEAIRRVVILTLKSPRFLYPSLLDGVDDDHQHAIRLAFTLWDSIPDEPLWDAAAKGRLNTDDQIREFANRMIKDHRTKAKTRGALHHWLHVSSDKELSKSSDAYPDFDQELVSDLRTSLDLFLESIVWSDASDFRQLLQADWAYTSERIAKFYGDAWKPTNEKPEDEKSKGEFSKTSSDSKLRVGVLTHPLLMSSLAYNDVSSPIHRGVFLTRHLLGRVMRPPADAFAPLSPDLHADLTTRERTELQTGLVACQSCHVTINALGFTLEQFDAVGRWRDQERSKPINATGSYVDRLGSQISFNGARELGDYLVQSEDAQAAFINRMFLHFVKQPIGAYGVDKLEYLKQTFRDNGFNVQKLIVEIAVIASRGPINGLASKSFE